MMRGRGRGRGGSYPPGGSAGEDNRGKDKTMRSIFVANVSFDTTEEQLGVVLREVGPIVNLKLIYDLGTGKPRGFGFCEYEDAETAMSAVRNLAGRELNGRPLRIDSASNAPLPGGGGGHGNARGRGVGPAQPLQPPHRPEEPSVYGNAVPPEDAPKVITKAVASLPPEQMFELMKQMKWFIQQNPQEARQLLLHNPQLAYALLQAQVVMKIVDVDIAHTLLHRTSRGPSLEAHPVTPSDSLPPPPPPSQLPSRGPPIGRGIDPGYGPPHDQFHGQPPPPPPMRGRGGPPPPEGAFRMRHGGGPPGHFDSGPPGHFDSAPPGHFDSAPPGKVSPSREVRPPAPVQLLPPRGRDPPQEPPQSQDQEKAALIMQVLSLTEEQIQMLPPDQRTSILKLKEQIGPLGMHPTSQL